MATQILQNCLLSGSEQPNFVLVKQNDGVDGSFLISCILGQRLKLKDQNVIFLTSNHNFNHYHMAGQRLGYNLTMQRDANILKVIDLNEIAFKNEGFPTTNEIYDKITSLVNELGHEKPVSIVIDDISSFVLFNGTSSKDLISFCEKISQLKCSTLIKLNTSDLYEYVGNNLEDLADLQLDFVRLKSGNFKEVDGKINIITRNNGATFLEDFKRTERTILYKVNERNVRVFMPGELGLKI